MPFSTFWYAAIATESGTGVSDGLIARLTLKKEREEQVLHDRPCLCKRACWWKRYSLRAWLKGHPLKYIYINIPESKAWNPIPVVPNHLSPKPQTRKPHKRQHNSKNHGDHNKFGAGLSFSVPHRVWCHSSKCIWILTILSYLALCSHHQGILVGSFPSLGLLVAKTFVFNLILKNI